MAIRRVYKYGARIRSLGPRIREQMRLGHKYYNQLVEAENAHRRKGWGGDEAPHPPEHECIGKKCKACKKHWNAVRRAVRELGFLDIKPLRTAIATEGLYWGTYNAIEEAYTQARRTTDLIKSVKYRSRRQGMQAAVQIQKSKREDTAWRMTRQLDPRRGRRARGGHGRHVVQIRVGSTRSRRPIWSEPIQIERHRVHEGKVVGVRVVTKWHADKEKVSVQLTCKNVPAKEHGEGVVAVDASWRLSDDNLRIGWARNEWGMDSVPMMGAEWIELGKRADRIRSERDRLLNELKAADSRFSRVQKPSGAARVIARLEEGEVTEQMTIWQKRDRHLWQYEVGCRRHSVDWRRDFMRKWVNQLRLEYDTVLVKDTDHKKIKEEARENNELHQGARRRGHHAAPGELIEMLRQEFPTMVMIPAPHTTQTCLNCGHETEHGPETVITCESCGYTDDRDRVSTENMLRRYRNGEGKEPSKRKTTARYAKRHAK